jgi:CRP-like cAMP-binding protein
VLLKEADTLRKIPLFATLEPSKLKLLAFTSDCLTYEDGEIVFHEGEVADAVFVILEGEAEIVVETAGKQLAVGTLGKDELFGELAVLNNAPRSATLRAKGHLKTLHIAGDMFIKLLTENPGMALAQIHQLSQKLARAIPR